MVIFVKILTFSKIMVKIGGSVEAEISARWQNFFKKNNLQIHICMPPKYRFHIAISLEAMLPQLSLSQMSPPYFFFS